MPPPHVLVHLDHAYQYDTWQLTGHWFVLHNCTFDRAGHAAPPLLAWVVTARVAV